MKIIFYITILFIPLSGYTNSKCNKSFSSIKKQVRDYQSAKEYVQRIGVTSQGQFKKFRKEKKIPKDIPSHPEITYKDKGWRGWGHFLGTNRVATQNRQFQSFKKAKEYVQRIGVASEGQYYELSENGRLPKDIPSHPGRTYKDKGWRGWGHFLGTNRVATHNRQFRSFEKAKEYVRAEGIKRSAEYIALSQAGALPPDMPSNPYEVYTGKGWSGWKYFLGTIGVVRHHELHKTGEIPFDLSSHPDLTYKDKGWRGWRHFLGTGRVVNREKPFRSYKSAQEVVQQKGITSALQYYALRKTGEVPFDMPSNPNQIYKDKGWRSWGHFLGTGRVASYQQQFRSFKKAQKYVQQLGITSNNQYHELSKKGELPSDLPSRPDKTYKGKGWRSWGHFLGTGRVANREKSFRSYESVQEFVQQKGVVSQRQYRELRKTDEVPFDLPSRPDQTYKGKGWRGWKHFLGTIKMMTYTRAQNYVIDEGISTREELYEWLRSGEIPVNFPPEPHKFYSRWTNVRDFLRIQELDKMSYLESKEYIQGLYIRTKIKALRWLASGDRPDSFPISPREFYGKKWEGWDLYLGLNRVNGTSVNNKAENHQKENGTRLDEVFSSGEKDLFLEDSELNTGL